ncbi:MAG: hypothetical protein B9J98_04085 [Candidatus Terraquivivens tikiterensis]|uniref:Uncharacterized protein n=1 Tax=Candidatus Terraquivivens tikiterensis TaxID=1980982 RepID=A0A2R7Y5H9_9ARCH|nr:MAG: hypothetical protein B9J98_04085 [Candidatus Terraquivivens tikiterensis]
MGAWINKFTGVLLGIVLVIGMLIGLYGYPYFFEPITKTVTWKETETSTIVSVIENTVTKTTTKTTTVTVPETVIVNKTVTVTDTFAIITVPSGLNLTKYRTWELSPFSVDSPELKKVVFYNKFVPYFLFWDKAYDEPDKLCRVVFWTVVPNLILEITKDNPEAHGAIIVFADYSKCPLWRAPRSEVEKKLNASDVVHLGFYHTGALYYEKKFNVTFDLAIIPVFYEGEYYTSGRTPVRILGTTDDLKYLADYLIRNYPNVHEKLNWRYITEAPYYGFDERIVLAHLNVINHFWYGHTFYRLLNSTEGFVPWRPMVALIVLGSLKSLDELPPDVKIVMRAWVYARAWWEPNPGCEPCTYP